MDCTECPDDEERKLLEAHREEIKSKRGDPKHKAANRDRKEITLYVWKAALPSSGRMPVVLVIM